VELLKKRSQTCAPSRFIYDPAIRTIARTKRGLPFIARSLGLTFSLAGPRCERMEKELAAMGKAASGRNLFHSSRQ